jgi:hypothetical protein
MRPKAQMMTGRVIATAMALGTSLGASVLPMGRVDAAAVDSGSTPEQAVSFRFDITGLAKGQVVLIDYVSGTLADPGGVLERATVVATAKSGALGSVAAVENGFSIGASLPGTSAEVTDKIFVAASPVQGRAYLPDGVGLTVTNERTQQTFDVKNGTFSVPTGLSGVALGASSPEPGDTVVFTAFAAQSLALTSPDSSGQAVTLNADTGDPAQVWKFSNPGNPSVSQLINQKTGFCLSVGGPSVGSKVIAAQCDDSKNQLWVHGGKANGSYRLLSEAVSEPALVMSASVGSPEVELAKITGDELEEWLERPVG